MAISRPPFFTALALWFVGGTYWLGGCFPDTAAGPRTSGGGRRGGRRPAALGVRRRRGGAAGSGCAPGLAHGDGGPARRRTPQRGDRPAHLPPPLAARRLGAGGAGGRGRARPDGLDAPAARRGVDARHGGAGLGRPGRRRALPRDHFVFAGAGDALLPLADATWADWDRRGRLVVARQGRLLAGPPGGALREIADFTAQAPEPAPAPAWARTWP